MKDWGRWRWHLKFTARFKSLLNFIKFYTHGSQSSVHLYVNTVHMYCMYSTCVQHVMSLPVPAWWHWSGCRGSSSRSRSQGSLGSAPFPASPELWAAPEPELRAGSRGQALGAEHRYTWPGHCTRHQPASTPATTSSLYYTRKYKLYSNHKDSQAQLIHLCLQIRASLLIVRKIIRNMYNEQPQALRLTNKLNYT